MKASPYLNDEPFCFNQKHPSYWVNQGLQTSVGGGRPPEGAQASGNGKQPKTAAIQLQSQIFICTRTNIRTTCLQRPLLKIYFHPSYKIKTSPHPPGTPPCAVFRCKNQSLNQQGSIQRQWWEGVAFNKELMHLWAKTHCRTLLSSAVFIAVKSGER